MSRPQKTTRKPGSKAALKRGIRLRVVHEPRPRLEEAIADLKAAERNFVEFANADAVRAAVEAHRRRLQAK